MPLTGTPLQLTLLWFEDDLRLADNAALQAALTTHGRVLPLFILPEANDPALPGAAGRWWLYHSLQALDTQLRERGSRLLLQHGDPRTLIPKLVNELGITAVYWNRRYTPHQQLRDRTIEATLQQQGCTVLHFPGALLHEPWSIVTGAGTPYRVFTPFWRSASSRLVLQPPLPVPQQLPPVSEQITSLELAQLQLLPSIRWDGGLAESWRCGEVAAQQRLTRFCDSALHRYPEQRDLPALDGTSRLSPHLRFGELTPRQLLWQCRMAAESARDNQAAEAFIRQLYWREFAYHLLHHFPDTVAHPLDRRFDYFPWRDDRDALQRWQRGETGIPLVDAGMRQLWQTGWMHNRVRMIAASLLTKNLQLPWQQGAAWFMETLVDGDIANNTLGWQWVAGCGADAAPYFRIFNPVSQGEKFDPHGEYLRRWLPELAALPERWLHQPWRAPNPPRHYPPPLIDLSQSRTTALAAWQSIKSLPR